MTFGLTILAGSIGSLITLTMLGGIVVGIALHLDKKKKARLDNLLSLYGKGVSK